MTDTSLFSGLATETTSVAYSSNHASTGALYQRPPNYAAPGKLTARNNKTLRIPWHYFLNFFLQCKYQLKLFPFAVIPFGIQYLFFKERVLKTCYVSEDDIQLAVIFVQVELCQNLKEVWHGQQEPQLLVT